MLLFLFPPILKSTDDTNRSAYTDSRIAKVYHINRGNPGGKQLECKWTFIRVSPAPYSAGSIQTILLNFSVSQTPRSSRLKGTPKTPLNLEHRPLNFFGSLNIVFFSLFPPFAPFFPSLFREQRPFWFPIHSAAQKSRMKGDSTMAANEPVGSLNKTNSSLTSSRLSHLPGSAHHFELKWTSCVYRWHKVHVTSYGLMYTGRRENCDARGSLGIRIAVQFFMGRFYLVPLLGILWREPLESLSHCRFLRLTRSTAVDAVLRSFFIAERFLFLLGSFG